MSEITFSLLFRYRFIKSYPMLLKAVDVLWSKIFWVGRGHQTLIALMTQWHFEVIIFTLQNITSFYISGHFKDLNAIFDIAIYYLETDFL